MIQDIQHTTLRIPTFEADGLRFRAPILADFDAYAEFRASPRAAGVGGPYSRASAFDSLCNLVGHWHLRGYGRWIVADPATDAPLGVVGPMYPEGWPEPEIAWSVFEGAEGRGIAYRAACIAREYVYRTLGWPTVISCAMPGNTRSQALARRMGATHEGDTQHPELGTLQIWRHPGPEALA